MSSIDTIQTNYNDDFDPEKKFHRILYKPGRAVQARELIQQQTILQNQIERFGTHIFKEGTIVLGGAFDQQNGIDRVDVTILTDNVTIQQFIKSDVVGAVTGIRANIVHATYDEDSNVASFYIRYKNSNEFYDKFQQNETLVADNAIAPECQILNEPDAIGKGSIFTVEEGVMFFRGFFVQFDRETIVMSATSSNPSCQIALKSEFKVVTSQEDTSLLDNARGTPNYTAPGADRLAVDTRLVRLEFEQESESDESIIFVVLEGDVWETKERTQYNRIYDELAARTYDESGDYTVRGMKTYTREHLNTGSNEGVYTEAEGGDPDLLVVGVEPGTSYVKGYEVTTLATKLINIPKSKEFENVNNQIVYARSGTHVLVNEITGTPNPSTGSVIELYDTAEQRETNQITYNGTPTGTKIGEAKIKSVLVERTENDLYLRVYLMDIKIDSGYSADDIQAVYTSSFFADVDPDPYGNIFRDQQVETLVVYSGNKAVRSVRSVDDTIDTSYSFSKMFDVTADISGNFFISSTGSQSFPYGSGSLQSVAKNAMLVTIDDLVTVSQTGTISCSGSTVTGSGTAFSTTLNIGEKLETGTGDIVTITEIVSDFELNIAESYTFSGESFFKKFVYGDAIDMNGYGSDGTLRSITASPSSLSFETGEDFGANVPVKVICLVSRNEAQEASKEIKKKRFVKFDVSALSDTRKLNLGIADVVRIRQVRLSDSDFTTSDQGTNVTSNFRLQTGQRDSFYDHSRLEANLPLSAGDYLLVELDYFEPSFSNGYGYFSVDSYPINDEIESDTTIFTHEIPKFKSPTNGSILNLRNCLDFRPVKANTATDSTTVSGASTNPSTTQSFKSGSFSSSVPTPGTQITFDYSFYLPRKDVITLSADGEVGVELGDPSLNVTYPAVGDEVMGIAQVLVPPFPSISSSYARILGKAEIGVKSANITNRRYSMKDIGKIDKRIKNLEYYNALNMLEKKAVDLNIQDENGLDRFKNGFFVDGFMDHSLGAQYNPDYNIAVDQDRELIRPKFENDDFSLYKIDSNGGLYTSNNVNTLPFTEKLLFEQPNVTTYRNIEQSVYRFVGKTTVTPPHDMWVDDTVVDKTVNMDMGGSGSGLSGEYWNSWEKNVSGYNVYNRDTQDTSGHIDEDLFLGSYESYEDAIESTYSTPQINSDWAGATGVDSEGNIDPEYNVIDSRAVIEEVSSDEKTGKKITSSTNTITEELGTFVTDVSLIPYIRPQKIRIFTRGLKANTRFYIFFDGEDMSDYVTPFKVPEESGIVDDSVQNGDEGDPLRSDQFGELVCFLRLPKEGKRFRVGTKNIKVTDSPTNSEDASSYSEAKFHAQGLKQNRQNTILSTTYTTYSAEEISDTRDRSNEVKVTDNEDITSTEFASMAYSFMVEAPESVQGLFMTSVDVFIQSLDPELGVWFEIREMGNNGTITKNQVPYSEVWMKRDDSRLKTSEDASEATNVNFENPVFLYKNTQYAFVMHAEGVNPNTYFFISRLGEEDIITGDQVTSRKLTGSIFTTNNDRNWDVVPDIDLKVRFNRAKFEANSNFSSSIYNEDVEFIYLEEEPFPFFSEGDDVTGTDKVTLSNINGGAIPIGSYLVGQTSGTSGEVVSINTNSYRTTGRGFEDGEVIEVEDGNGASLGVTASVVNVRYGKAKVLKVRDSENRLNLTESNGEFFIGSVISNSDNSIEFPITQFRDYKYSTMRFNPSSIVLNGSSENYQVRARDASSLSVGNFKRLPKLKNYSTDSVKTILSKSIENMDYDGEKSLEVQINMSSVSDYISPVVDHSIANAIFIRNKINDDITGEDESFGGELINKYISKVVTLAPGQDGQDLNVFLSNYRPPDSNIKVWVKLRHRSDLEDISEKEWIELNSGSSRFSPAGNNEQFIEARYSIPRSLMTGPEGEYQYVSDGKTFNGFSQFDIKIGLLGDEYNIQVPKVKDARAIALQM